MLCQVSEVSKRYGEQIILDRLTCQINPGEKIGLIGRNGCGKSTLLKIIAGEIASDHGEIHFQGGTRVRYLSQMPDLNSERTVWEEILTAFKSHIELEQKIRAMEKELSTAAPSDALMKRYETLVHNFETAGGYYYQRKALEILDNLGLRNHTEQPVSVLSGGQKTKLALAKILAEDNDLLLLDEPSNHLDLEATIWLETFLSHYKGAILMVSHDRSLLNGIVTRIFEVEHFRLHEYKGNYIAYKKEKALRLEQQQKAYLQDKSKRTRLEDFIRRNLEGQKTKQAKARRIQLNKMEKVGTVRTEKVMSLKSEPQKRLGTKALDVENLSKSYPSAHLFENINLTIAGEEKITLIGPNGCGKTTLFRILAGDTTQDSGKFKFGQSAEPGFFYQEHSNLNMKNTLLEEMWAAKQEEQASKLRDYLAAFGFHGDDVLKEVGVLSGGERSRLLLAKLLLEKHNFLLLDEPTNHLDIPSIEVLENFLIEFPGTVLLISHDRSFIDAVTKKILAFENGDIREYLGNYSHYFDKKNQNVPESRKEAKPEKETRREQFLSQKKEASKNAIDSKRRQKRIAEIEKTLEELEAEKHRLEEEMIAVAEDYKKAQALGAEHRQVEENMESLLDEWHVLESK